MEIVLTKFQVEVAMPQYLLRGSFQPRGDLLIYLNDQGTNYYTFSQFELLPLGRDYHVPSIRQPMVGVNENFIAFLSVLEAEEAERLQVMQSKRPFVFYTDWFAVRGNIHVNPDARDTDLMDGPRDYFAVTEASIFSIRQTAVSPTAKVPLVLVHRTAIYAYHPYKKEH